MLPRLIVAGAIVLLAGCGGPGNNAEKKTATPQTRSKGAEELVLYCGVEPSVARPLIALFERSTKIRVNVKFGRSSELTAELLSQGKDKALADVVWSAEPVSLQSLLKTSETLMGPLPREILVKVPRELRGSDTRWIGVSARVIVPVRSAEFSQELPAELMKLLTKSSSARFGYSDAGDLPYFVAWLMKRDAEPTRKWTAELAGQRRFKSETRLLDAMATGQIDLGFVGHDTLLRYRRSAEFLASPRGKGVVVLPRSVPDSLVKLSGVGVMAAAPNKKNAEHFVDFLIGEVAQQYLVASTLQCPVRENVAVPKGMIPQDALKKLVKQQANQWPSLDDRRSAEKALQKSGVLTNPNNAPDDKKKKSSADDKSL